MSTAVADDQPKVTRESLDGCHVALRQLLRDKKILEDVYYKGLVELAARWIELGEREDAVSLVCELTPDYVAHTMPAQIKEDPEFAKRAMFVAAYLDNGLPVLDEDDVKVALMLLKKPVAKA